MRRFKSKFAVSIAVVAVLGLAGAGFAVAQTIDDKKPADPPTGAQPAALNSSLVPEAKFVPVTPCRLLDTRAAGGKIAPNTVRGFDAFGTDLSAQGGSGSGCGIPSNAEAIDVNLTAVDPDGTGFLRGAAQNSYLILFPDPGTSQTLPNATLLNYSTALNASNAVTIPVCGGNGVTTGVLLLSSCSGGKEFRLGTFTKASHVVADVVGYFVVPPFIVVDADPTPPVLLRANDMGGITRNGVGSYTVATSRDLRGCAFTGSIGNSNEENALNNLTITVDGVDSNSFNVFTEIADTSAAVDDDWSVVATC